MENIILNTKCGELKGYEFEDYLEFRGIKYANAERWEYPVPVTKWEGVYDATEFGPCCPQTRAYEDDKSSSEFYWREFRQGLSFTYGEKDCLCLNVWAPKNAEKAPIAIYIHGGSFSGGSNDEGQIVTPSFAQNGIVYVTINYRLNAFGFANHPDLTDSEGRCGNFGLYDQICAIQWVKDNAEAFGGDAENITVIGASAGAMSVDILLSSPLCEGLFQRAIMMSGAGMQRWIARPRTPEKCKPFWEAVMQNAGVNSMSELKALDAKDLYYAWNKASKEVKMSIFFTLPSIDGKLLTESSYTMKTIPSLPMIFGTTSNDMMAPIILKRIAQHYGKKSKKNANVYYYSFNRHTPGDESGAWHSSDILYAFSTLDFNWRPFEEIDYKISNEMAKSFYAFIKTGDPNCNAIPKWEVNNYNKPMRFCEDTKQMKWDSKTMLSYTLNKRGTF